MIRKMLVMWIALNLAVFMGTPAKAAEGSIRVKTGGQDVSLYYLGQSEATGYRLLKAYGGGYLTFDDTLSSELAAWFAGKADSGIPGVQDANGTVFAGLQEGLYLVCGEFEPFMVTLPWDGFYWEVEVDPMNSTVPQTGDGASIAILTMVVSGAGMAVLGRRRKKC